MVETCANHCPDPASPTTGIGLIVSVPPSLGMAAKTPAGHDVESHESIACVPKTPLRLPPSVGPNTPVLVPPIVSNNGVALVSTLPPCISSPKSTRAPAPLTAPGTNGTRRVTMAVETPVSTALVGPTTGKCKKHYHTQPLFNRPAPTNPGVPLEHPLHPWSASPWSVPTHPLRRMVAELDAQPPW